MSKAIKIAEITLGEGPQRVRAWIEKQGDKHTYVLDQWVQSGPGGQIMLPVKYPIPADKVETVLSDFTFAVANETGDKPGIPTICLLRDIMVLCS